MNLSDEKLSLDAEPVLPDPTILDLVASACMFFTGICLTALIVIFGWLVFGRYVLNNTPTWVEQVALLLVVYITFLGAAVGVHRNTHLSIEFIRDMFPPKLRSILIEISDLGMLAFAMFMVWQGWGLMMSNVNRAIPMIGLSESWRAAPVFISGLLISLFTLVRIYTRVRQHISGGN